MITITSAIVMSALISVGAEKRPKRRNSLIRAVQKVTTLQETRERCGNQQIDRERNRQTERQTDRETDRETERQTGRQRQEGKQTDRQTDRPARM